MKSCLPIQSPSDEAFFWIEQSLSYFESSKVLDESASEYKTMPVITLQAFSIECSLKSLLLLSIGNYPAKHDLVELFTILPNTLRNDLATKFSNQFSLNLDIALNSIKRDFMDSRYFFSDFKKSVVGRSFSTGYLEILAEFFLDYFRNHGDSINNFSGTSRNPFKTFSQSLIP